MTDKQFPSGIRFTNPHPNSPDFIKGRVSFKVDEFTQYLQENQSNNWVNLVLKQAKSGNLYFDLDTWKPNTQRTEKYKSENRVEDEISAQQEMYGDYRPEDNGEERERDTELDTSKIPF